MYFRSESVVVSVPVKSTYNANYCDDSWGNFPREVLNFHFGIGVGRRATMGA